MSIGGRYQYWEGIQVQGYTNKANSSATGLAARTRAAGWITYHMSGNEWLQVECAIKRPQKTLLFLGHHSERHQTSRWSSVSARTWRSTATSLTNVGRPHLFAGQQTVTTTTIRLTWFPERKVSF